MTYTTLQLLLRHQYSGVAIPESEAVAELNRRGWFRPVRVLVLLIIIPLILPERICNAFDMGDPWETASLRTLIFSALFSVWSVAPFICAGSFSWMLVCWLKGQSVSFTLATYSPGTFVVFSVLLWLFRGKWA